MANDQTILNAVDHVVEHPQVWTERLAKSKWGDRIPHVEHLRDGIDCWVVNGRQIPLSKIAQVGALMADRVTVPERWHDVPDAAYIPSRRLEAMDQDGVDSVVFYPTLPGSSGERFGTLTDPELELACVQAYNDWLIDEWASVSHRFIPQCIVPLWPVDSTVTEIKRAVAKGHRGVILPAAPMQLRNLPHINSAEYDPIWATCQDLNVPLCFHAGSSRLQFPVPPALSPELSAALRAVTRPASAVFDLTNLLFSRILLRFPKLNVVFAESTIGWGTFLLEYADHQYEQDHCNYPLKPSEMFARQCYLTSWYDPVKRNSGQIGTSNILWATNFPAANSTWPDTQAFAKKCLAGLTADERAQITYGNAAALYKL
jgi:uncharacterized protein